MKLPVSNIVALFNILNRAKLTAMSSADKFKVIGILRVLRPVGNEWNEFVEDAKRRLAPDDADELQELQRKLEGLEHSERRRVRAAFEEWQSRLDECLAAAVVEEKDISIEAIGESGVIALMDSNPEWSASEIELVDSILNP